MQFKELLLVQTIKNFVFDLSNFNTTLAEVFMIKVSYYSDPKRLNIEYKRLYDKLKDRNYQTNLANYLDLKFAEKSQMELLIEATEAKKSTVKDIQRPTNIIIYEFYMNFINVISQSKLFYLDFFLMTPTKSSGDLIWLENMLDNCYHIIACSMKKSFESINKLNHKNIYLNEKVSKEGTINNATSYYTGKIAADKDL